MSNYNCDHEDFEGAIKFDQLDGAIIGYGNQFNNPVVIYDYSKCLEIFETDFKESCDLQDDECREACDHYLEAIEWMDHNVTGAWVGSSTPVFIHHRCADSVNVNEMFGLISEI